MIKTEPWTGGTEEEYETQHFGFGSQRLKIAVRQMVEQKIKDGVKNMESSLQESLGLNEKDKETLKRCIDKLVRLYCERAEPSLQAIDAEIERILKVPSNVLLPSNECQIEQITDAEYVKLKEEVASLRKRVERGATMTAILTHEEKELAALESVCEMARKDMEAFDSMAKDFNVKTTENEAMFLCASANCKEIDFNVVS